MRLGLLIFLLALSSQLTAQSTLSIVKRYTKSDGLSSNRINCIREDCRGFIWIGTNEGLNRFDGWQFKNYYTERNNPQSLGHNFVLDILEYKPGMLLIATYKGVCVLNTFTGQFENEKITFAPLKPEANAKVTSLYKDKENNIWVNHDGELDVFDNHLNYVYRFTDLAWAQTIKGTSIILENWYTDKSGRMWLPTDTSGIQIIDFKANTIDYWKNNPKNLPYLKYRTIRAMLVDEESNSLFVAPWGEGLQIFDFTTGQKKASFFNRADQTEENTINSLTKTEKGTVLFNLNSHSYEIYPASLSYYPIGQSSEDSVSSVRASFYNNVTTKTKNNNYWSGGKEGLFHLKSQSSQNEIRVISEKGIEGPTDLSVSTEGAIYATFANELLIEIGATKNTFRSYKIATGENSILTEAVQDHQQNVWIGSSMGIYVLDRKSKTVHRPAELPDALLDVVISVLFCDTDGDIWIATREPLMVYIYHSASGQFSLVNNEILYPFIKIGTTNRISAITQDSAGRIWMTSEMGGGILCFDKDMELWSHFPKNSQLDNLLLNTGITALYSDGQELLWISRIVGDGLFSYNYRTEHITHYSREDALLSENIGTIHADHKGVLWLTSEYGIIQFNPTSKQIIHQQLWSENINTYLDNQVQLDPHSENLIMGYRDKIIFINATNTIDSSGSLIPLLESVYVNNQIQHLPSEQPFLNLNHTQNNISIDFTTPYFSNDGKLRFAYLLIGADTIWRYTTKTRSVQFSFLAPGTYHFQMKVAKETGEWSKAYELVSFTIVPPFWKTPWFILSAGLAIIFLGYRLIRKRIKLIRNDAELKQKIAETEMMALRAQMNPHFIFNCINSIDSLIQSNDKYLATIYLNKFAKLIRNILDSSKLNSTTLGKDLETLKLYIELEQFRNENKFSADIVVEPGLLQGDYKVPPLVIQPFVENAILHGLRNRADNAGRLNVTIKKLDGYIQYTIEDNGVGRKNTLKNNAGEKQSYGMDMSSERIRLFNHEEHASVRITDLENNGTPSGTKVEVFLKII